MADITLTKNVKVAEVVVHQVPDQPGIAAEIFGQLGQRGFNVELVISSPGVGKHANISFAVKIDELDDVLKVLEELKPDINFEKVSYRENIGLLTLSWHMLSSQPGSAGRIFGTLSKKGINIQSISTSLSSITVVVRVDQIDEAEACLKEEFGI
ncbi:MAG TPA: ACT domain-containing protein [candidate division Zixibacteria bacterium]|nr:ACT domain-containing protein [candidate division Zixibacteria bacterium]